MNQLRIRAESLRHQGYSYRMIHEKIGVSKSTLSDWLSRIKFVPNQEVLEKIEKAKLKSALFKQRSKFRDIALRKKEAIREIGRLKPRDIFMLGIGVYIGEGAKSFEQVKIANSDPMIINLALKWLRSCFKLQMRHFCITLHTYPDIDNQEAIRFWSKETGVSVTQFTQTVIDRRDNKSALRHRKLPYGTAHLYIRTGKKPHIGNKSMHRKIMGWIECSTKQI